MPKGIGQRGIGGRAGLAGRQVAARYRPAQSVLVAGYRKITGSGVITSPAASTIAEAWLIGAGGYGEGNGANPGAGGAGAVYKRWIAPPNCSYAWAIGVGGTSSGMNGGDTTMTHPSGTMLAGGGKASTNGGIGGVAAGGDINRAGGSGVLAGAGIGGGTGGGAGGSLFASIGGGGGSAGFGDVNPDDLTGGNGATAGGAPSSAPGGGGSAGGSAGQDGRLICTFTKIV